MKGGDRPPRGARSACLAPALALIATLLTGCFSPTVDIGLGVPATPDTVARATAAAVGQRTADAPAQSTLAALQATNDALSTRVAQPTATTVPPTPTAIPPTATPAPPTATTAPPTATAAPPSPTRAPVATTIAGVPPAPIGNPSAGPAPALDPGWTLHARPEDGFALALPPGWSPLGVTPGVIMTMTPQNQTQPGVSPELAGAIAAATIRFVAVELTQESMATGNPGTAMVGRIPAVAAGSLDEAARQYVVGLENNPTIDKPIERRRVDLPAGPAERVAHRGRGTVNSPTGPRQVQMAMVSHVWLRDTVAYVLVVGGPIERQASLDPAADQIARAFRWQP